MTNVESIPVAFIEAWISERANNPGCVTHDTIAVNNMLADYRASLAPPPTPPRPPKTEIAKEEGEDSHSIFGELVLEVCGEIEQRIAALRERLAELGEG